MYVTKCSSRADWQGFFQLGLFVVVYLDETLTSPLITSISYITLNLTVIFIVKVTIVIKKFFLPLYVKKDEKTSTTLYHGWLYKTDIPDNF